MEWVVNDVGVLAFILWMVGPPVFIYEMHKNVSQTYVSNNLSSLIILLRLILMLTIFLELLSINQILWVFNLSIYRFYCGFQFDGARPQYTLSSRVNDGFCDCCDGSDEWDEQLQQNTNKQNGKSLSLCFVIPHFIRSLQFFFVFVLVLIIFVLLGGELRCCMPLYSQCFSKQTLTCFTMFNSPHHRRIQISKPLREWGWINLDK